jgi:anaphase-promoting complex subunit 3
MTPAAVTTAGTRHNPLMNLRSSFETPGLTPIAVNASTAPAQTPLPPPPPTASSENNPVVTQRARQVASRQYYQPSPETPMHSVTRSMRYLRGLGAEDSVTASKSGTGARSLFLTSENQSSNQGPAVDATEEGDDNLKPASKEPDHAVQDILDLMSVCGAAVQSLSQYRCREALLYMMHLPIVQQATPWVLHIQGRAFLEKGDFTSAEKCLEHMHRIDPGRMQGLELLSTVYWQLKKEVELANLAQHATDWDYQSPEAHCVAGNCFSLQKDHETALVFFKRSLQLNADFTYTHTLAGYEYIANEDFDRAAKSFRQALRTDERHYNAWYGLGVLYHRQEKFDLAEYHFARAVQIHPNSSVLRCNLGMAQVANGKAYEALETLSEAFRLDPRNPQARFQRATIYSTLNRPEEALQELKTVRDAAPREATVHFAMGKILKRLGRPDEAMKCFLTAMDLDPKDNQMIKSAMDKLDEQDVDEESTAAF